MATGRGARTWRLLRLSGWSVHRCKHCGQPHEYLARPVPGAVCQPVLFPPGLGVAAGQGTEVEVFSMGPIGLPGSGEDEDDAYQRVARRVAACSIRCERCGERFEDLGAYDDHPCD